MSLINCHLDWKPHLNSIGVKVARVIGLLRKLKYTFPRFRLDLNKLCLNITKSKFMLFHMPQRITPQLHLNIKGSPIENVNEFNFLGLTLDCNLNFKPHTKIIAAKISRVIGVLHKLKYILPAYLLRMIYNSLILPHLNYSLLAWGIQCPNIELLQKKAVRVVNFKSPVAHTEPILKGMNQTQTS